MSESRPSGQDISTIDHQVGSPPEYITGSDRADRLQQDIVWERVAGDVDAYTSIMTFTHHFIRQGYAIGDAVRHGWRMFQGSLVARQVIAAENVEGAEEVVARAQERNRQ